jgi:hypothetical protein
MKLISLQSRKLLNTLNPIKKPRVIYKSYTIRSFHKKSNKI